MIALTTRDRMEKLLKDNMEAGFPVDPLTLSLKNGWDFDVASPPNLVPRKGEIKIGRHWVLPDNSQPGHCYVFDTDWEYVWGGEWDTPEQALAACKEWAENNQ